MPKTFNIRIEETVAEDFTIKADSSKTAILKAKKLYCGGKLVLEPGTLTGRRIGCTDTEPYTMEDF